MGLYSFVRVRDNKVSACADPSQILLSRSGKIEKVYLVLISLFFYPQIPQMLSTDIHTHSGTHSHSHTNNEPPKSLYLKGDWSLFLSQIKIWMWANQSLLHKAELPSCYPTLCGFYSQGHYLRRLIFRPGSRKGKGRRRRMGQTQGTWHLFLRTLSIAPIQQFYLHLFGLNLMTWPYPDTMVAQKCHLYSFIVYSQLTHLGVITEKRG